MNVSDEFLATDDLNPSASTPAALASDTEARPTFARFAASLVASQRAGGERTLAGDAQRMASMAPFPEIRP